MNTILFKIPVMISLVFAFTSCRHKECRTIVTLTSGQKFKAFYIKSYVSGVSNVKLCDGTDIQFKTSDIVKVVEK